MKILLAVVIFLATPISPTTDISMLGLKIGSNRKSLDNIKLKVIAKEDDMVKFQTSGGNELSVTCEHGKIVYMENDWLQNPKARQPLFSDFQFGRTTLREIRKKMGTNGFTYKSRTAFNTDKDLIEFNCFEFDSPNNEILVTITKIALNVNVTEDNVADNLKIDAIIIADKSYCDRQWGSDKLYDENYKKIKP
jgi:hypothetical protein